MPHVPQSWTPAAVQDEGVCAISFIGVPTACTILPDLLHKPHRKVFSYTEDTFTALDVLLVSLGVRIEAIGDLFTQISQ